MQQAASDGSEGGDTALHIAVRNRLMDSTKCLIQYGADKGLKNHAGLTPYAIACTDSWTAMPKEIQPPSLFETATWAYNTHWKPAVATYHVLKLIPGVGETLEKIETKAGPVAHSVGVIAWDLVQKRVSSLSQENQGVPRETQVAAVEPAPSVAAPASEANELASSAESSLLNSYLQTLIVRWVLHLPIISKNP